MVIQTGTIRNLSYNFLFVFYIVTMALVSFVSVSFMRYSDFLVENRKIFIPHLYLASSKEFHEDV